MKQHATVMQTLVPGVIQKARHYLTRPIDIAPLIYVRIVVGTLMTLELSGGMFRGYLQTLLHGDFHFSYMLTPWIKPWPEPWAMYVHFILVAVLSVMVIIGAWYRLAIVFLFIGAFSIFLMDQSLYINHVYLYCMMALILAFLPANRAFSIDARRNPAIVISDIPAWMIYIFIFMMSIVYIYSGIAKLNADWLEVRPIQSWLKTRQEYPVIGGLLVQEWYAYVVAYGGLLFDLGIVPLMIWQKTRRVAFAICVLFHITNAATFGVGLFPWFSMAITALFFPPETFRRWTWLDRHLPAQGTAMYQPATYQHLIHTFMIGFVILQLLLPLRQFLYPGNPSWSEAGHQFSWRLMLRMKSGYVRFYITDKNTGRTVRVNIREHLNSWKYQKMIGKPDMILAFAHYLRDYYKARGLTEPEVRVLCKVSLNGRPMQVMIDTSVNLAVQRRSLFSYKWIKPLQD